MSAQEGNIYSCSYLALFLVCNPEHCQDYRIGRADTDAFRSSLLCVYSRAARVRLARKLKLFFLANNCCRLEFRWCCRYSYSLGIPLTRKLVESFGGYSSDSWSSMSLKASKPLLLQSAVPWVSVKFCSNELSRLVVPASLGNQRNLEVVKGLLPPFYRTFSVASSCMGRRHCQGWLGILKNSASSGALLSSL